MIDFRIEKKLIINENEFKIGDFIEIEDIKRMIFKGEIKGFDSKYLDIFDDIYYSKDNLCIPFKHIINIKILNKEEMI
jgi:small-conductance mechanosensitive channel